MPFTDPVRPTTGFSACAGSSVTFLYRSSQQVVVSAAQRVVLEQAAALAGMEVVDYVRHAVVEQARRDLRGAGRRTIGLNLAVVDEAGAAEAATFRAGPVGAALEGTGSSERYWRWRIAATMTGPARMRTLVRAALAGHGLDGQGDVCLVLLSELVTNAVRYGGPGGIVVQLTLDGGWLVGEVSDHNPDGPAPRRAGPEDEGGRGLALLVRLSAASGWYPTVGGKTVWFAQDLRHP
ncbi:ATP-binding protein [Actinomadura kijaniata]|uniref:ATP-binding protein n=1 Tax=Actinomadura kijaniata TaxID=46161 RepID=UPI003F1DFE44